MNTKEGGNTFRRTMIKKYGNEEAWKNRMREVGAEGGRKGRTGGVYNNPEMAAKIGALGGRKSKVGLRLIKETATKLIYKRSSDNSIVEYDK